MTFRARISPSSEFALRQSLPPTRRPTDEGRPMWPKWPRNLNLPSMSPHLRTHNNHEQDISLILPCEILRMRNHHLRPTMNRSWSKLSRSVVVVLRQANFLNVVKCRARRSMRVFSFLYNKMKSRTNHEPPSSVGFALGRKK